MLESRWKENCESDMLGYSQVDLCNIFRCGLKLIKSYWNETIFHGRSFWKCEGSPGNFTPITIFNLHWYLFSNVDETILLKTITTKTPKTKYMISFTLCYNVTPEDRHWMTKESSIKRWLTMSATWDQKRCTETDHFCYDRQSSCLGPVAPHSKYTRCLSRELGGCVGCSVLSESNRACVQGAYTYRDEHI